MDIQNPKAVIGTNSWGGKVYGKLVRGNYVDESTLKESIALAKKKDLLIFDFAQDYGLGKAQRMMFDSTCSVVALEISWLPIEN